MVVEPMTPHTNNNSSMTGLDTIMSGCGFAIVVVLLLVLRCFFLDCVCCLGGVTCLLLVGALLLLFSSGAPSSLLGLLLLLFFSAPGTPPEAATLVGERPIGAAALDDDMVYCFKGECVMDIVGCCVCRIEDDRVFV